MIKPEHEATRKHFLFTDEHLDLRESMSAWVKKEMYPHRNEWEETYWPSEVMRRAGELGYLGLCFPEEYGGQGGDYFYSLVRAECMSYSGSGGTNMGFAVQTDMVLPPVHLLGTEEQKQRYLVPGIKGEKIGCLGITEPGAGSDVAGIRTTAIRDGDEYVINGAKTFITNGPRADFCVLVTKTDPDKRHDGITLFLVDLRDDEGNLVPGFTVSRELEKMGMHASDTGELAFEDMRVPADAVLGEIGKGFYHISWELQGERLVAAAGCYAACGADVREDARVRQGARGVRAPDRQASRRSATSSPTWRRRSRPPSRWSTRPRGASPTASTRSARSRWRSCSRPASATRSPTSACRSTAATAT